MAPTAVAIKLKGTNIDWIDAFDVRYMPRGFVGVRKRQLIAEIAFGATFCRNYWLIVENTGTWVDGLVAALKDLELHSIGVAEFDRSDDKKFKVRLRPELTAEPDL